MAGSGKAHGARLIATATATLPAVSGWARILEFWVLQEPEECRSRPGGSMPIRQILSDASTFWSSSYLPWRWCAWFLPGLHYGWKVEPTFAIRADS